MAFQQNKSKAEYMAIKTVWYLHKNEDIGHWNWIDLRKGPTQMFLTSCENTQKNKEGLYINNANMRQLDIKKNKSP